MYEYTTWPVFCIQKVNRQYRYIDIDYLRLKKKVKIKMPTGMPRLISKKTGGLKNRLLLQPLAAFLQPPIR